MEKGGVPSIALISPQFREDAVETAEAFGMPNVPMAFFGSDELTNLSPEAVREVIGPLREQVVEALITSVPRHEHVEVAHSFAQAESFDGQNLYDSWERFNKEFLDRGWGDGFPLMPPTPARVELMLKGTRRAPDQIVTSLEPGMGLATVEKLAINAVMAGCEPEHMPILIAAVEAMSDRKYWLRNVAQSTGPHAPMMVINGPIAKKLGVNSGRGALGPGRQSRVNTVLGRAIRLMMMNIGHTYVGSQDMDTLGSPNKYSMCVAENEDENPWSPLHVERGYKASQSTVTMFSVESQIEIMDMKNHTPEGILTTYIGSVDSMGSIAARQWMVPRRHADNAIILCPAHARAIAEHGWSKDDIKRYIYEKARRPAWMFKVIQETDRIVPSMRWILDAPDDTLLPVTGAYDWYHVLVVGGPGPKSSYTSGLGQAVTRLIEE